MIKKQKEQIERFLYEYMDWNESHEFINFQINKWTNEYNMYKNAYENALKSYLALKDAISLELTKTYKKSMNQVLEAIKQAGITREKRIKKELRILSALEKLSPIERTLIQERFRGDQFPRLTNWETICNKLDYGRTRLTELYDAALYKIYTILKANKSEQKNS